MSGKKPRELRGGNLRSIVWQAESPARKAPETGFTVPSGHPVVTLLRFEKLLWIRG
jgi:hypothetical protein